MAEYTEYRVKNSDGVAVKVTEEEYRRLVGDRRTARYVNGVWSEKMTIDEVPEGLRDEVQTIVDNRIAWCGTYENQPASIQELLEFVAELATE